jgi:signal transduction histidine kinase
VRSPDVLIAGAFVVAAATEAVVRYRDQPALVAIEAPGSLLYGCVALRRRRPLLAISILTAGAALGTLAKAVLGPPWPSSAGPAIPIFAILLLTYSLGAYGTARELAIGSVLPLLVVLAIDVSGPTSNTIPGALLFFAIFIVGVPAFAGRLIRVRRSMVGRLREQERGLEDGRAAQAGAALALERVQLADRLDGTLVAGIGVLATRARAALDDAGGAQPQAIAEIESGARALLAETRKVVVSLASMPAVAGDEQAAPATADARSSRHRSPDSIMPWLVVAGAGMSLGLMLETRAADGVHVPLPVALLACVAITLPLATLWRRPLLMVSLVWTSAALFAALVTPLEPMFTAIALSFVVPFVVAYLTPRRQAVAGLFICCLGELSVFGPLGLVTDVAFVLVAWVAGRALRDATGLVASLRLNSMRLQEQHEARLRQALLEEREQYARDLHDSIGHALTVAALQAGAARRMWSSSGSRAAEALRTVERVAAGALEELNLPIQSRVAPRLSDVDDLVREARGAGLNVEFRLDGTAAQLPPDVEFAAYRVIQEALTNVLKHAPDAAVQVTLSSASSHLGLSIVNDKGSQSSPPLSSDGQGLRGMRQRVERCGGEVEWGPEPDGGFKVRARFAVRPLTVTT